MQDHYFTITKNSEGLYKEKGSKFLAFAFPCSTLDEVKLNLEMLRKQYFDARHHCYAYILGNDGKETRANDDGEPNHSAGDPILGQIKSRNLTNTLVVVIRYFGGTKLGVSGLINAYKTSASEALNVNEVVKRDINKKVLLKFPYDEMNNVMKLAKELNLKINGQDYDSGCIMEVEVIISQWQTMIDKLTLLNDTGHNIRADLKE